jgi:hypothetical protein
MYHYGFAPCPGTVVVHRGSAITCTGRGCRRDVPDEVWLELHSRFVRCGVAACELCSPASDHGAHVAPGGRDLPRTA